MHVNFANLTTKAYSNECPDRHIMLIEIVLVLRDKLFCISLSKCYFKKSVSDNKIFTLRLL